MNYSVHAIMYGYYFLMATKQLPKWFPAPLITVMKISQMFIGMAICASSLYYRRYVFFLPSESREKSAISDFLSFHLFCSSFCSIGHSCNVTDSNMLAGGLMYFSYFCLFVQFAINRFVLKSSKKTKTQKADKQKKEM